MVVSDKLIAEAQRLIGKPSSEFSNFIYSLREKASYITGWRMEGTLREFPSFKPRNVLFQYPTHRPDEGLLNGAVAEGEAVVYSTSDKKAYKEKKREQEKQQMIQVISAAYEACFADDDLVKITHICEFTGDSESTIRRHLKAHPELEIQRGIVRRKK